mmetsp:Transcript_13078/g.37657  ORF Transcript_13078/g.37657 Transcript_13078/m.37657 type:complete len:242 (-) Transcript_13078:211-936(-)
MLLNDSPPKRGGLGCTYARVCMAKAIFTSCTHALLSALLSSDGPGASGTPRSALGGILESASPTPLAASLVHSTPAVGGSSSVDTPSWSRSMQPGMKLRMDILFTACKVIGDVRFIKAIWTMDTHICWFVGSGPTHLSISVSDSLRPSALCTSFVRNACNARKSSGTSGSATGSDSSGEGTGICLSTLGGGATAMPKAWRTSMTRISAGEHFARTSGGGKSARLASSALRAFFTSFASRLI